MTMIFESGQACHFGNICKMNDGTFGPCWGTRSDRNNTFTCEYIENGKLKTEVGFRNPLDQTGKMKVIWD